MNADPQECRDLPSLRPRLLDADAGPAELDRATLFILRHWKLIGVAALSGALLGWFGSHFMSRQYRAEVLVSPAVKEAESPLRSALGQFGAVANLAGLQLGNSDRDTAVNVATLRSRVFLERFIADENLLPVLFVNQWDASRRTWRVKPGKLPPSPQDGYQLFVKEVLSILEDKDTGLVTIRVDWRDPVLAARWANELIARLNAAAQARAISDADRSVEYLNRELEHTQTVEIRQSIYSLLTEQINTRMMANTHPDFAFNVIDPAQIPELNHFVRPIPLLNAAIGFFTCGLLAMLTILLAERTTR